MKKLFFICFGIACTAYCSDLHLVPTNSIVAVQQSIEAYKEALAAGHFTITTNEEAYIKQKIDAYDQGKLTIKDLNENAGDEGNRELMGYYFLHTNDISTKAKLPISRSFTFASAYPEAALLAEAYVNVYSNDSIGWHCLAYDYTAMHVLGSMNDSNKIFFAYNRAVRLGDTESLQPIILSALVYDRLDIADKFVPQLMKLYQSNKIQSKDRLGVASLLLGYSLKSKRKDIFLETLKGENLKEFLRDERLKWEIELGCKIFEGKDIDKIHNEVSALN
ncbi:MAG TPA: hypothetical protein VHY30_10505 [Verrucomicrobiae bacterium]|jgi:hypothetical protein|nr:hypothetical protein [Verrucomicrobiae bacterium]